MNAKASVSLNSTIFFHLITSKYGFEALKVDRFLQLLASLTKITNKNFGGPSENASYWPNLQLSAENNGRFEIPTKFP